MPENYQITKWATQKSLKKTYDCVKKLTVKRKTPVYLKSSFESVFANVSSHQSKSNSYTL